MEAGPEPLHAACRAALADIERAESLTMAEWLAPLSNGRTLKQCYAEAATLAWDLDRQTGGPAGSLLDVEPRTAAERQRRPVLMLVRELRECLGRVAARLEAGLDLSVEGVRALIEIGRLVALTPAPSPAAAGEGSL